MKTSLKAFVFLLVAANLQRATAQSSLEVIPSNEDAQIDEIVKLTLPDVEKNRSKETGEFGRDVHQKSNGCMKAEFNVLPNLPASLAKGLFATPTTTPYKSWIRFSAALPGADKSDTFSPDARGMAIKVIGVKGEKLIDEEKETQDFVMINNPIFFVNDVAQYLELKQKGIGKFLLTHPKNLKVVLSMISKVVENPLTQTFFSMSPILVGQNGIAAKYKFEPYACDGGNLPGGAFNLRNTKDRLRDALIKTMDEGDACFVMKLQPQLLNADGTPDQKRTPVEQGLVDWDDAGAPYYPVATIRVPSELNKGRMGLDNQKRIDFCEDISMAPWHSLVEHRPLGGLNRSRLKVYKAISDERIRQNAKSRPGAQRFEPTGNEDL